MDEYIRRYHGCVERTSHAKAAIWQRYCELNKYCKQNYMDPSSERLDRHKVAACYMIAITSVRPLFFTEECQRGLEKVPAINETLAITVGCSIVSSFAVSELKADEATLPEEVKKEKQKLIKIFKSGIVFPDKSFVRHGNYIENFANELHYAVADGSACILSFAHELYLLEVHTQIIKQKK